MTPFQYALYSIAKDRVIDLNYELDRQNDISNKFIVLKTLELNLNIIDQAEKFVKTGPIIATQIH